MNLAVFCVSSDTVIVQHFKQIITRITSAHFVVVENNVWYLRPKVFSLQLFSWSVWLQRMCLFPTLRTKAWNWFSALCSFAGETLLASSHSGGKGSGEGWPHSSSSAGVACVESVSALLHVTRLLGRQAASPCSVDKDCSEALQPPTQEHPSHQKLNPVQMLWRALPWSCVWKPWSQFTVKRT